MRRKRAAVAAAMTAERDIWTEPSNEGIYDTLVDGVDVGFGIVLPHWAFNAILATFPIIALVHELGTEQIMHSARHVISSLPTFERTRRRHTSTTRNPQAATDLVTLGRGRAHARALSPA